MRIGIGFDAHRLVAGRKLFLGGVDIPFEKGLQGHSDADVLLHAIIDAMLGAAALGNIGQFFSDTDPKYKDISSLILLKETEKLLANEGYKVNNLDTVVILEEPRLENYWDKMQTAISQTLALSPKQISLKAKRTEEMGFTGRKEGIAAMSVVVVSRESGVGSRE